MPEEDKAPLYDTPSQTRCCPFKPIHFRRHDVNVTVLVMFIVSYLVIGAVSFGYIERPKEREIRKAMLQLRNEFLDRHAQCLTGKAHHVDESFRFSITESEILSCRRNCRHLTHTKLTKWQLPVLLITNNFRQHDISISVIKD